MADPIDPLREIRGRITTPDGKPLAGLRVLALDQDPVSEEDKLGEATTDEKGAYLIRYPPRAADVGGREKGGADLVIRVLHGQDFLAQSAAKPNAPARAKVDLRVDYRPGEARTRGRVEGRIVLEDGHAAEHVEVRLYRAGYGGAATLVGVGRTGPGGRYVVPYAVRGSPEGLEVRVLARSMREVPVSTPIHGAAADAALRVNLVAPASVTRVAPEHQRLLADVKRVVGDASRLADAQENGQRRDLSVLHRDTGWDARLLGLAAAAERLASREKIGLTASEAYALLRVGLPSDPAALARVSPEAARQAFEKARGAGIVEADADVEAFGRRFAAFATATRLAATVPGSRHSYADMLDAAGLDAEAKAAFSQALLQHAPGELWSKAAELGLDGAGVHTLQLQGKLAFLTANSVPMTAHLMQADLKDPAQLVDKDLHAADAWAAEVLAAAKVPKSRLGKLTAQDRKKVEAVLPASYEGGTVEDRLQAYAEDLARKVRQSYPTHVTGRLVERDAKDAFRLGEARAPAVKLLKGAAAQGFRLGRTPVAAFLRDHAGARAGLTEAEAKAAEAALKKLHCVYQITPTDEAMPVLASMSMMTAHDVTAVEEPAFVAAFKAQYVAIHGVPPPTGVPHLVYRKAQQVSSVAYNLFAIAKRLESEPAVHAISAPPQAREAAKNELVKQFPSMETLFGSTDYCECDHCRSVLSPAAYLVDLLQFLDPEDGVWANFLATWEDQHDGAPYPHKDEEGNFLKPYDVLVRKRPDLPHVPLTCENTHTAMPYIDLVNEILEYHVAHETLAAAAARDVAGATSPELVAEPQNVIPEAYRKLLEETYPHPLPFHLPLETVRAFCQQAEAPLADVMEALRGSDALHGGAPYDRAAIFLESLGFSHAEVALFANPDPLAAWEDLYGYEDDPAAALTVATDADTGQRIDLHSAKALSRRLGVTYKEVTDVVRTGFVNPELARLVVLEKLGVGIHGVLLWNDPAAKAKHDANKGLLGKRRQDLSTADRAKYDALTPDDWRVIKEVAAVEARIEAFAAEHAVTPASLRTRLKALPFARILVLADPDAGCDFDATTLRYADGAPADAHAFLRINLFVRLWRKLGWTMEETDLALRAFIPKNAPFEAAHYAKRPLLGALVQLAHLRALEGRLRVGKQARLKLLTLWGPLPTTGRRSLYAQLFLTRTMLKADPVFDDPLGEYLQDASVPIGAHRASVQGALGLTATEVDAILWDPKRNPAPGAAIPPDNELDPATAPLTLANLSRLYRHALLAKGLGMSVQDLLSLKALSGLDPFQPPHPSPIATLAEDHPYSGTLAFVDLAQRVKESGLSVADLEHLLRHRFDPTRPPAPDAQAILALVRTLADGVATIRAEHALPEDPGSVTDDALRQKLGLLLPADAADRALAMFTGTAEWTATATAAAGFPAGSMAGEPAFVEASFNATRSEQKLTYRGVPSDARRAALLSAYPKATPHAPSATLEALLKDVQQQAKAFHARHLQKGGPAPASGFLDAADYALLFEPDHPLDAGESPQARERRRRATLARALYPHLQQRLVRDLVVRTLAAHAGAPATLTDGLVADKRLLGGARALLDDLAPVGDRGVRATFHDAAAAELGKATLPDADTGARGADGKLLRPAGAAGALLEGYVEVPASGAYRFLVVLDQAGAKAELRFDHLPTPLLASGTAAAPGDEVGAGVGQFLELRAGVPYRYSLRLRDLGGGDARLLVQSEALAKGPAARLLLRPAHAVDDATRAIARLDKALRLLQGLGLDEREARHILGNAADFGGVDLGKLPTTAAEATLANARALFAQVMRLAAYARLKREAAGGTSDLVDVFEAQHANDLPRAYAALARVTRRDEATVKATAEVLFAAPAFRDEQPVARLWEALRLVERVGVPAASLVAWTRVTSPATPVLDGFTLARDAKEALRARFDEEAWLRAAQPVFDKLRKLQRDALVARTMHKEDLARVEQLYELFLIDPGMEPVVHTSRIRLAISSVQLFIQRALLNLEPDVHPSTIPAKQWEWMKRYRVWEANRKIFLFPENWLEPEFRDDKTHLFQELEGALLQGDVSDDLVEDAFLAYLRKLDELARLDVVAMHVEDAPDPSLRVLHVFGRTYATPHKYHYRRYAHGVWSPWEPVTAEVTGDHLAPVVWRGRLVLFWVTFLDKPDDDAKVGTTATTGSVANASFSALLTDLTGLVSHKNVEATLHWSERVEGEWSGRATAGSLTRRVSKSFDPRQAFVHVSRRFKDGEERGAYVHLDAPIDASFYLESRNSVARTVAYGGKPRNPYATNEDAANRYSTGAGNLPLRVSFAESIVTKDGKSTPTPATRDVLAQPRAHTLLPADNVLVLGTPTASMLEAEDPEAVAEALKAGAPEIESLMKPVFYQDRLHTFFVEPSVVERTVEEIEEWVTWVAQPEPEWEKPDWWDDLIVIPQFPEKFPLPKPDGLDEEAWQNVLKDKLGPLVNPTRTFPTDWISNPRTLLRFGDALLARAGQGDVTVLDKADAAAAAGNGKGTRVNVAAGSDVAENVVLVAKADVADGMVKDGAKGVLNVVGPQGFNAALALNKKTFAPNGAAKGTATRPGP